MDTYNIYKHCPIFIQNILCCIKGAQLERERYGGLYQSYFEQLIKSERWNCERIKQYKEEQLFEIIENAYRYTPYYKKKFSSVGLSPSDFRCLEDLRKFPILTKEDVRNNWKGMISSEFKLKELIPYHTSGSTGKALDFYWTYDALRYYWAVVWRGRKRFDINKGDCHLNFTGKIVIPLEQNKPPYWRYNKPLKQYMFNMQHLTSDKISAVVDFINSTEFSFFVGYPSIMNTLSTLIYDSGLQILNTPKYIFSSAEKMYEHQKKEILKVFPNTSVVEHYGFSENAAAASKCNKGIYHEDFELGHLELKEAIKTDNGYMGEMLATGFKNIAMPFIRYEIGDTGTFSKKRCSCGLQSQVIIDIEGRNGDYVITPEGAKIMRFGYIFKETSAIKECQIIQNELGSMIVRIVKRDNYSTACENQIKQSIKEWVSPTILVQFEYVDIIERTKSGKFKTVISNLNK